MGGPCSRHQSRAGHSNSSRPLAQGWRGDVRTITHIAISNEWTNGYGLDVKTSNRLVCDNTDVFDIAPVQPRSQAARYAAGTSLMSAIGARPAPCPWSGHQQAGGAARVRGLGVDETAFLRANAQRPTTYVMGIAPTADLA